jgi:hypothetical protein
VTLAVLAVTLGLCAGCGLFKPAIPEQAKGTVIIGDYSYPDSTIATMARGIEAKGNNGGQDAYIGALADTTLDHHSFQALFDPLTVQRYVSGNGKMIVWQTLEENHFYALLSASNGGNAFDMRWSDGQASDEVSDTLVVLYRKYEIFLIQHNSVTSTLGYGYAELRLVRSGTQWKLWRWIDREAPSAPTDAQSYGQLRLKYQ